MHYRSTNGLCEPDKRLDPSPADTAALQRLRDATKSYAGKRQTAEGRDIPLGGGKNERLVRIDRKKRRQGRRQTLKKSLKQDHNRKFGQRQKTAGKWKKRVARGNSELNAWLKELKGWGGEEYEDPSNMESRGSKTRTRNSGEDKE